MGDVYSVLIQWINDSPRPNLCNDANINVQFTLSTAFSVSREVIMVFKLCNLEVFIRLNKSVHAVRLIVFL